jgi:hypothetical protein
VELTAAQAAQLYPAKAIMVVPVQATQATMKNMVAAVAVKAPQDRLVA